MSDQIGGNMTGQVGDSTTKKPTVVQCQFCGEQYAEELEHRCRVANVSISLLVLQEFFFPKGTKVLRVLPPNPWQHPGNFHVTITHPELDPVSEGNGLPDVLIECHADEHGNITEKRLIKS